MHEYLIMGCGFKENPEYPHYVKIVQSYTIFIALNYYGAQMNAVIRNGHNLYFSMLLDQTAENIDYIEKLAKKLYVLS
jgi:hypothetical protein